MDVMINGALKSAQDALISVQDRGFRYGDGVFETIAVEHGVPYLFEAHAERLALGLSAIKIPADLSQLAAQCKQLLQHNQLTHGVLRIQVTRGCGSAGYLPMPMPDSSPTIVIETSPFTPPPFVPASLWQSAYQKISLAALPVNYKLCQGLNSILPRIEAMEHKCAEALLLNERGELCESSSGNIFWLADNVLYTPALDCGVLAGICRADIIRLAPCEIREVCAPMNALLAADAVFLTNSLWPVLPIGCIEPAGKTYAPHPFIAKIRDMLLAARGEYCAHRDEWH